MNQSAVQRYMNSSLVTGGFRLKSHNFVLQRENNEPIHVIYQFFISKDQKRYTEVKEALKRNVENKHISKIYLLNERIYTCDELGISSDKIIQILHTEWLKFSHIFDFVENEKISGYIVTCNSDIFFDNSIRKVIQTDMHKHKIMCALLRFEYGGEVKLQECKIFGPRWDSQDTWIFHSNYNIEKQDRSLFDIYFGQPGCDNKIIYYLTLLGYTINNDPMMFKTYHIHEERGRNYSKKPLSVPYGYVVPENVDYFKTSVLIDAKYMKDHTCNFTKWNYKDDNKNFIDFLKNEINKPMLVMNGFTNLTFDEIEKSTALFTCEIYNKKINDYNLRVNKKQIWNKLQNPEIFLNMKEGPWTHALQSLKCLFVCNDAMSLKNTYKNNDIFTCLWLNKKPKFLHYHEDVELLKKEIKSMKDGFDILIIECNKNSNMIAYHTYTEYGKSVIISNIK